ncbi:MAG: type II toxin-antitoxin system HicA family toxin [bacterium]|nr:type II toxin-antitoxin system HicA family toxin [bacterium]
MPKLPQTTGKYVIKAFLKIDYVIVRQRGSHIRLHHPRKRPLTIPNHKIGKGLLKKLLRDSHTSVEEFTKLLK